MARGLAVSGCQGGYWNPEGEKVGGRRLADEVPRAATRESRLALAHELTCRLVARFGSDLVAVGLYGSLARGDDGPFSDIEMCAVLNGPAPVRRYEFVYRGFKVEVDLDEREVLPAEVAALTEEWPVRAGQFLDMVALYDPEGFIPRLRRAVPSLEPETAKAALVQVFVDDTYEMMGKVRNAWAADEGRGLGFLPAAAVDLVGQTAKLLGLAHRHYYRGRSTVIPEALSLSPLPAGFRELAGLVTSGDLGEPGRLYAHIEALWTGLLAWVDDLGLKYDRDELPF
jgi:kanamycin nucleotidyltransferase